MRRWWVVEAAAVVVTTVWLAVRIDPATPSTLWLDDAWLALVTKADSAGEVVLVGVTAPGFAAVLWLVHELTGAVESLVHVAYVAALAVPVVVYAAGRHALRLTAPAAVTGAVVAAAAPVIATYAGRVKPYTADAVLAALVLGLAAHAFSGPEHRRRWVAFVAIAIAAVMLSGIVAVTVAGAALAAPVAIPRARWAPTARAAWPAAAAGAVVAVVWGVAVLEPAANEGLRRFWDDFHTVRRAPDAAAALLPLPGGMALLALGAAAVAALAARRRHALLAAPFVVAAVLGVAGVIPLGGGRTDAHLVPAAALLVAAALDRARPRAPAALGALALAVVAVAVLRAPDADPYPAEDLGPLVARVEADAADDDRILVYSSARWAYALETAAPIELHRSDVEANGFEVSTGDPRTVILPRLRDDPDEYPQAVQAATGDAATVWLLVSHPGSDVPALEAALGDEGFTAVDRVARPGAELSRWERATR